MAILLSAQEQCAGAFSTAIAKATQGDALSHMGSPLRPGIGSLLEGAAAAAHLGSTPKSILQAGPFERRVAVFDCPCWLAVRAGA